MVWLTLAVLLGMLAIGLHPRDFCPPNRVAWIEGRPGLRFEKAGIAHTDYINAPVHDHLADQRQFSIEIAFKAEEVQADGFRFLFLLHAGDDHGQLLFAQWRSWLIVMNADDYSHRRRLARLSVKGPAEDTPATQFITVTSGPGGSRLYCNGELKDEKKQLRLKIPEQRNLRLLLGNSITGRNPWQGEIYGLALYNRVLAANEAAQHFHDFYQAGRFAGSAANGAFLLYRFDQKSGDMAFDSTNRNPLQIPPRITVLTPRFFFQTPRYFPFELETLLEKDVLLNFFGFIPLGLLLTATGVKIGGRMRRRAVWLALAGGFFVSLFIETVQAWLPARSSDLRDLILNSCGTLVGVLCFRLLAGYAGRSVGCTPK